MKKYHAWLDISAGKVISQPMQRILCHDYVKKINGKIIFELGEDVEFKSYNLQFRKMISSKLKVDGFILGHDYVMGNWMKSGKYGVIEAVAEFCVNRNWKLIYWTADFTENNSFAIQRIK